MTYSEELTQQIKQELHIKLEEIANQKPDYIRVLIEKNLERCNKAINKMIGHSNTPVIISARLNNNLERAKDLYSNFIEEYNNFIDKQPIKA